MVCHVLSSAVNRQNLTTTHKPQTPKTPDCESPKSSPPPINFYEKVNEIYEGLEVGVGGSLRGVGWEDSLEQLLSAH